MGANEGVAVEALATHKDLARSFCCVSYSAWTKLRRQQRAIWMSVWLFGGAGVGGPLAVILQLRQRDRWSLLVLAFNELLGLLGKDRRLRGLWHALWADIDSRG